MSASVSMLALLLNAAATLFMTGLIWFVQVVHYPLFGSVGTEGFSRYETLHASRTTFVVGPPMLLQIPRHNTLGGGYDADAHRALVSTNWIRTLAWSARTILVLWMLAEWKK